MHTFAQPVWTVLERRATVRLDGFVSLCMPALLALHLLDLPALPQHGTVGTLLAALAQEYGSTDGLKVARAAAIDALRFVNAQYDTQHEEPCISWGRVWTRPQVTDYLKTCQCEPAILLRMRRV